MPTTLGFGKMGADGSRVSTVVILFIYISSPADGILSAFVVIFIISFSIGCGSGLVIINTSTTACHQRL